MINSFWQNKIQHRLQILPLQYQEDLKKQAEFFSEIGINSDNDYNKFNFIMQNIKNIVSQLTKKQLSQEELIKIAANVFEKKDSINSFYDLHNVVRNFLDINKLAYFENVPTSYIHDVYDINKWIESVARIYENVNLGQGFNDSFNQETKDWDVVEKNDFRKWVEFYQEGAHLKYKRAQFPSIISLPKAELPSTVNFVLDSPQPDPEKTRQDFVTQTVNAIIGRLNAAERLATKYPEVQQFLRTRIDGGLASWLEILHKLKREIQAAPREAFAAVKDIKFININPKVSNSLIKNLFLKEAAIFSAKGNVAASFIMKKLAQETTSSETSGEEAMNEFIRNMNFDSNEIEDMDEDPMSEIKVVAQEVPLPQTPVQNIPDQGLQQEGLPEPQGEVTESTESEAQVPPKKPEDIFDLAMQNVGIPDVIDRLEALAAVFRNREISRQLAIIDLMMDRLRIASFFPSLAEASGKTLESNQYALTRIEDIISKLRGSMDVPKHQQVDLGNEPITKPLQGAESNLNPEAIRQNLNKNIEDEKARKERRKNQEIAKENEQLTPAAPTPEITNTQQELAQPVEVQQTAPSG